MLLFIHVSVVKTMKYIFGASELKLCTIFELTFFLKQTFSYIIFYVDLKKKEFKLKKISGEFKVATVSQPSQAIGLVPVGP